MLTNAHSLADVFKKLYPDTAIPAATNGRNLLLGHRHPKVSDIWSKKYLPRFIKRWQTRRFRRTVEWQVWAMQPLTYTLRK